MPPETHNFCPEHTDTIRTLGRIEATMQSLAAGIDSLGNTLGKAFSRIDSHIDEGEKLGGSRDRIRTVEKDVGVIQVALENQGIKIDGLAKRIWRTAVIGGIIGGLIGHITPDFFALITAFLKLHLGG